MQLYKTNTEDTLGSAFPMLKLPSESFGYQLHNRDVFYTSETCNKNNKVSYGSRKTRLTV